MKRFHCFPLALFASVCFAQENLQILPEVVVTGEASALELQRESATQKTVLDRQAIEATGGLTVGEVLGKLPGIAGTPSSDRTVSLGARGMARDGVQVLLDGERLTGHAVGGLLSRMPAGELERVEIVKGVSAEFGGSAPVTINLVSTRGKRRERLEVKAVGSLRRDEPSAWLSLGREGAAGNCSWNLPLSINRSRAPIRRDIARGETGDGDSSWQDERERGRNLFDEYYFAPKLNWKNGKDNFSIWPSLFYARGDRRADVERAGRAGDGTPISTTRNDRDLSHYWIQRLRAEGELWTSGNKLSGRLSLTRDHRANRVEYEAPGLYSQESRDRVDREANGSLRVDRAQGKHMGSAGLDYADLRREVAQQFRGDADAGQTDFNARERQGSLWFQDEWEFSSTSTLTGGLRGEWIRLEAEDVRRRHAGLYPSLALRQDLSDGWILRLAGGAQVKAPKLDDLGNATLRSVSANSPLEPDVRGNPNLRPERSLSVDANLEYYTPDEKLFLGFGLYARRTRDFVERRAAREGVRWVERPYNEGTARHWGLEFDAKLKTDDWGPRFAGGGLRLHLTLPHARVDDRRLGFRRDARELPRYLFSVGYDLPLPSLESSFGFLWQQTGRVASRVPGEQWADTRRRAVVDIYWIRKLDRTLNLRFTLQNLLGEERAHASRFTSDGREWRLDRREAQPRVLMLSLEGKW